MTGKELQKLRRQELLQLLLEQSREVAQLRAEHSDADQQARQLEESNQRLEARLGDKDALRGRLQGRLDAKEGRIQQLEGKIAAWREARRGELGRAGTVAGAAVRLNGLHGAAQQAAGQYLYNIRLRCQAGAAPQAGGQGDRRSGV